MTTAIRARHSFNIMILLLIGLFFMMGCHKRQESVIISEVDHAGIIRNWNEESLQRGKKIYINTCSSCHGIKGVSVLPMARSFQKDTLQTKGDPYDMWWFVKFGYRNMPPQRNYTAEEIYDAIHYIREAFIKPYNHSQYVEITQEYLDSLSTDDEEEEGTTPMKSERRPPDYGPVLSSQIEEIDDKVKNALIFNLGQGIFFTIDPERMRQGVLWEGALNLSETWHMAQRGIGQPFPDGGSTIGGLQTYYWAFTDNLDPIPEGEPVTKELLEYHGYYLYQKKTILSFSAAGREIFEMPGMYKNGNFVVMEHTIQIGPGEHSLKLCVGQFDGISTGGGVFSLNSDAKFSLSAKGTAEDHLIISGDIGGSSVGRFVVSGLVGETQGLRWELDGQNRLGLHIFPSRQRRTIRVLRYSGEGAADLARFQKYVHQTKRNWQSAPPDITTFLRGGPRRWPKIMTTKGLLNVTKTHDKYLPWEPTGKTGNRVPVGLSNRPSYVLDDIPLPERNPWHAWIRPSALDFFSDGRIAVSSLTGDVWIVSGLDDRLQDVRWQRYAAGLSQPLGLKIIDDVVYVTCNDGIIRLHDFNKDGEADFYELFYADHDADNFKFELHADSTGHLYYTKGCLDHARAESSGAVIKVSPDGKESEVVAEGLRVPNGMGIDAATDAVYVSDQEGEWIPASKISAVPQNQGGIPWFGYSPASEKTKETFIPPVLWMPMDFDNSSGGQLVVHDKRFGPLDGKLIHTSYGKGWMYYVMQEEVNGVRQGSAVAFPFQFKSGVHRVRVNPVDGQVYAVGLTGWQTEATEKDGCLSRIRYTGTPAYLALQTHIHPDGIQIDFSFDLDKDTAGDAKNYRIEQWNYRWTSSYGSQHWSVKEPDRMGHDPVPITSAKVLDSSRSVFLAIPGIQPVHQMAVDLNIKAADGTAMSELIYLTINEVPESSPD